MASATGSQLLTTAQAARVLGVTRTRFAELAASTPDFPREELIASSGRRWPRAAIEAWAAAHPDRGPVHQGSDIPPVGECSRQAFNVLELAIDEAKGLGHSWVGEEHLLLALLHPRCPGAARLALQSLGIAAAPLREVFVASMGDLHQPSEDGIAIPPLIQLLLERANLEAFALADPVATSEHVLLALTGRWDGSIASWLRRRGIDAATVRQRVVDLTEGGARPSPASSPLPAEPMPPELDPAPGLALAPTPAGVDPRRRLPWASVPFEDANGRTFRQGIALRQYFVDRDGNPVLAADGRPVHLLIDEHGDQVLDAAGRSIGPVEIPPGCQVVASHGDREG